MRIRYERWIIVLAAIMGMALCAPPAFAQQDQPESTVPALDAKVAIVNGATITQADLNEAMNQLIRMFASRGRTPTEADMGAIRNNAVESLIERELFYQESEKKGTKVDEETLSKFMIDMKGQLQGEGEFEKFLKESGMTESELLSRVERDMQVQKYIEDEILSKVEVSEEEIRAFYDENPQRFKQPEQVQASHILVQFDPGADDANKAEARKEIEEIQKKQKDGGDFAELAREYSDCPSGARSGGDLGPFTRGRMVPPFEQAAFAMEVGETSDIVETQFGYHLIKVTDKKSESIVPYEKAKGQIEANLKQMKIWEEIQAAVTKLKEGAEIEKFPAGAAE